jgi:hypothetical protein
VIGITAGVVQHVAAAVAGRVRLVQEKSGSLLRPGTVDQVLCFCRVSLWLSGGLTIRPEYNTHSYSVIVGSERQCICCVLAVLFGQKQ